MSIALPYDFGSATTSDRNFFTQLQDDLEAISEAGETWFTGGGGTFISRNLVAAVNGVDANGILDIDVLWPGLIPASAKSVILTIECGYGTVPAGTQIVQIRVMPSGYNLGNILDRAKCQQVFPSAGVDEVAIDVSMPVRAGNHTFFYAVQSTDAAVANKNYIIDCWGYRI